MASFYGSLVAATQYHTEMGSVEWSDTAYDDTKRLAAMRRATRVMDGRFATGYSGYRSAAALVAGLGWPRDDAYDYCAGIAIDAGFTPVAIEEASYEIALQELISPGIMSPVLTLGRITKSESVDGAASRSFFSVEELGLLNDRVGDAFRPSIAAAEDLLSCYLRPLNSRLWAATVV